MPLFHQSLIPWVAEKTSRVVKKFELFGQWQVPRGLHSQEVRGGPRISAASSGGRRGASSGWQLFSFLGGVGRLLPIDLLGGQVLLAILGSAFHVFG